MKSFQFAVIVSLLIPCTSGIANDSDVVVESLDAAVQNWLTELEFVCSYTLRMGRAKSLEEGLAGHFGVEFKDRTVSGVYVKSKDAIRCSSIPVASMHVVSDTGEQVEVVNVPADETCGNEVRLLYNPQLIPGKSDGSAIYGPRDTTTGSHVSKLTRFDAGDATSGRIGPLSITGCWKIGGDLRAPHGAVNVERILKSSNHESATVHLKYVSLEGNAYERRIQFRLNLSVPVIESESLRIKTKDGQVFEVNAAAYEFVECSGGPMARILRRVIANKSTAHPNYGFAMSEWQSHDLGTRGPRDSDFHVSIHKDVRVLGLADGRSGLFDGKLDATRVTLADLYVPQPAPPTATSSRKTTGRGFLILNSCVAILLAALLLWRRRK